MRSHYYRTALGLVAAAAAALAVTAPGASAEPLCKQIGKDGFGSDVCVEVTVDHRGVTVWAGCDIGTIATCAINPITLPPQLDD
jgi:hypothetical protein